MAFGLGDAAMMGVLDPNSNRSAVNTSGLDLSNLNIEGLDGIIAQIGEFIQQILPQLQEALSSLFEDFDLGGIFGNAVGGANAATPRANADANRNADAYRERISAAPPPAAPPPAAADDDAEVAADPETDVEPEAEVAVETPVADVADPEAGPDVEVAAAPAVVADSFSLSDTDSVSMYDAIIDGGATEFTTEDGATFSVVHASSTDTGFDAVAVANDQGQMVYLFKGMDEPTNLGSLLEDAGDNPMETILREGEGAEFLEDRGAALALFEGEVDSGYGFNLTYQSELSTQHGDFVNFMSDSATAAETKFGEMPHQHYTVGLSMGAVSSAKAAMMFGIEGTAIAPPGIPKALLTAELAGVEGIDANERERIINDGLNVIADPTDVVGDVLGDRMEIDNEVDIAGQDTGADVQFGGHGTPQAFKSALASGPLVS